MNMNKGGPGFNIFRSTEKKIISVLVNSIFMNSLFIFYYQQNSIIKL